MVAEVTIHYLQLFHYVVTVVTVCGWPLQTILDTLLKRPQLLANLQNGPSRKHFIRRRRILIAINAINVEETQPHCVHSLKKKELPKIFQYSSTEHEFPNLSFRKTFIPFIHVRIILCLLKYHDICEEEDFLLQKVFLGIGKWPSSKVLLLPNAYWRCLPWNIYSLKPSTQDPFPRPLISKVKKTLKVLILFRPCFWIFRKMQKTGTKTKLSSNNARSKVSTCPNQFVFLFLLFHKL